MKYSRVQHNLSKWDFKAGLTHAVVGRNSLGGGASGSGDGRYGVFERPKLDGRVSRLLERKHSWQAHLRMCVALLCLSALSGCTLVPAWLPHEKPQGYALSDKARVLPVPIVQQKDASLCGLVAMQMVAEYYHTPLKTADVARLTLATAQQHGLTGAELQTAFQDASYSTVIYPGSLDHSAAGLYTQIDAGRPVIVMIRNSQSQYAHYLVVSGYDPVKQLVIFVDPVNGVLAAPATKFQMSWDTMKRFSLLAVPRGPTFDSTAASGR